MQQTKPPKITKTTDGKYFHFEVKPAHTPVLIIYLRNHLNGFKVNIGLVEYSSTEANTEWDVFEVNSRQVGIDVLNGLLKEAYHYHLD